jgi:endonuclease/exonuclease/phosphatase family metal-dependent hydrolase
MQVKKLWISVLVFWLFASLGAQSVTLATWNIADLGRTKSPSEITQIARVINTFDVVAIQEVVAKDPAGARAVVRIVDELNRMGQAWDYRISDPTASSSAAIRERYAFIWKKSKCRYLRSGLDTELRDRVEREPFWLELDIKGFPTPVWLSNFHSRPFNQQPEAEIRYFIDYAARVAPEPMVLLGDWNLDEQHPVWLPFYAIGYLSAVQQMPTTLKRGCKTIGGYRNHAIDNIYYPAEAFRVAASGVRDFVGNCDNLDLARGLSDHLPVWVELLPPDQEYQNRE